MGIDVFPVGSYMNRTSTESLTNDDRPGGMRPEIEELKLDPADLEAYHKAMNETFIPDLPDTEENRLLSGKRLTKEFVDRFDAVMIMHVPIWIIHNWEVIKHKPVIWRTIGQSIPHTERLLAQYRNEGLKVVRYSPMEKNITNNIGVDALIRFYKDPDEFYDWTGTDKKVITISQSMESRGVHCHFNIFKNATEGMNRRLYGPHNEDSGIEGGVLSYTQIKEELAKSRVYFYTGTQPASYTLNFMEAAMTGIPIVAIGPEFANSIFKISLYEVENILNHFTCGYVSNDLTILKEDIENIINDDALAKELSVNTKKMAIELFGKETIKEKWLAFFKSMELM
jgi:glycosyltransferase involved in cell wall biosynthesis